MSVTVLVCEMRAAIKRKRRVEQKLKCDWKKWQRWVDKQNMKWTECWDKYSKILVEKTKSMEDCHTQIGNEKNLTTQQLVST